MYQARGNEKCTHYRCLSHCICESADIVPYVDSDVYFHMSQTQISVDSTGMYYEVGLENGKRKPGNGVKLEKAQISLNDCLACR